MLLKTTFFSRSPLSFQSHLVCIKAIRKMVDLPCHSGINASEMKS